MTPTLKLWLFVFLALVLLTGILMEIVQANDQVKYCRNATTGEIITVEVGMPCPFPTHEM